MISLIGRRPEEPADFAEKTTAARAAIADQADKSKLVEKDFEDCWGDYKHLFEKAQHDGKCAYCETRIRSGANGAVEHFRPKSEIREPQTRGNRDDTAGSPPRRKIGKGLKPGYYWLAYSWDNYLFACEKCNSTWKSNSFPLRGGRRNPPIEGDEKTEEALLLNPFDDAPEEHFAFNEVGGIAGRTDKGEKSVECLGLDRRSLEIEREYVSRDVLRLIEDLQLDVSAAFLEKTTDQLRELCRSYRPFAGVARFLVSQKLGIPITDLRIE